MAAVAQCPFDHSVATQNLKTVAEVSTRSVTSSSDSDEEQDDEDLLVVSPYTEREHLLDLKTLDTENALLARALVKMTDVRPDYATASYVESFNWTQVIEELGRLAAASGHRYRQTSFYIVVFRSQIPPTTVYADLGALDKVAHAEATAAGGFLKYWFGSPDAEGRNLATCLWRSQDDARQGNKGPGHHKAAMATKSLYSNWQIDRHRLTIGDGAESWEFTDWTG
ncbi:translation initiation factor 3 subunit H [Microdochium nivale]|nr:translation initiation factor 3 subunit H [Microdochium nivale]